jgi:hypothetical protein
MRTMTRRDDDPGRPAPLLLVAGARPPAEPRVRPERIAQARERIRQRYYDRLDVRQALVEALLVEFAAPGEAR